MKKTRLPRPLTFEMPLPSQPTTLSFQHAWSFCIPFPVDSAYSSRFCLFPPHISTFFYQIAHIFKFLLSNKYIMLRFYYLLII